MQTAVKAFTIVKAFAAALVLLMIGGCAPKEEPEPLPSPTAAASGPSSKEGTTPTDATAATSVADTPPR